MFSAFDTRELNHFCNVLQIHVLAQSTMRVWDVLFNEGANILFRVALAFFMVSISPHSEKLLLLTAVFHRLLIDQSSFHNLVSIFFTDE